MFASVSTRARRVPPTHEEWIPHGYQERAVDFLLDRGAAALFLDPGLGKTSITLDTFRILLEEGIAKKMLVIAPLRVCQLVWRQEAKQWTQFRHLKFQLLHGRDKVKRLNTEADVYLINPEGIAWLVDQFFGKKLPFDTIVIDELTKFKNAQSVRHKHLCPKLGKIPRVWGLTGTPIPNGYLDLFGQMKILDGGRCLGQYLTHYRNKYFEADYSGFGWLLRRGSAAAIEDRIAPYVLRMSSEDYLSLPPLIDNIISVEMPKKARETYKQMKKEMLVQLGDATIEAGNAAAVYSKLKQMANGAVYAGDGVFEPRRVVHLHDAKIEALQELIEELDGTPLLVAYEFNHDLARLKKALGEDTPYLGSGVSGQAAIRLEKMWNAGKLPVLLVHPASAAHGLNFQKGNACHIAWFSVTWDYELYDQLIRRIFRQGNKATRIFNHILIVENTIDNKTREVIENKGLTQTLFLDALNAEIYHGGKTVSSPYEETEKDSEMVKKLSRRNKRKVEDEEEEEEESPRKPSRRSSRRSSRRDQEPEEKDDDLEEEENSRSSRRGSRRKLRGDRDDDDNDALDEAEEESPRDRARGHFSKTVRDTRDDEDNEDEPEEKPAPKKRSRGASGNTEKSKTAYAGGLDVESLLNEIGDAVAQQLSAGETDPENLLALANTVAVLQGVVNQL